MIHYDQHWHNGSCSFAHSQDEKREPPRQKQLCREFFYSLTCRFRDENGWCGFAHGTEELTCSRSNKEKYQDLDLHAWPTQHQPQQHQQTDWQQTGWQASGWRAVAQPFHAHGDTPEAEVWEADPAEEQLHQAWAHLEATN